MLFLHENIHNCVFFNMNCRCFLNVNLRESLVNLIINIYVSPLEGLTHYHQYSIYNSPPAERKREGEVGWGVGLFSKLQWLHDSIETVA